jgi:hypothetical protein
MADRRGCTKDVLSAAGKAPSRAEQTAESLAVDWAGKLVAVKAATTAAAWGFA